MGWFPLGPRDIYRPAYPVSRTYFTNVNISNTMINNTNVTNVYNNRNVTNITYANQQVPGAVVTVPTTAFVQSQPVARAELSVPHDVVIRAPVTTVAAIAPMQVSCVVPRRKALSRRSKCWSGRSSPRACRLPCRSDLRPKERVLAGNPGKPIDPSALAALRPVAPVPAPKVQVVAPTRNARSVAGAPAAGGTGEPGRQGGATGRTQSNGLRGATAACAANADATEAARSGIAAASCPQRAHQNLVARPSNAISRPPRRHRLPRRQSSAPRRNSNVRDPSLRRPLTRCRVCPRHLRW